MIDEKQLRLSTNPQVQATLLLIDEVRQLKEVLGKGSDLVFLDSSSKQVDNQLEIALASEEKVITTQSHKPRGRKPREKVTK